MHWFRDNLSLGARKKGEWRFVFTTAKAFMEHQEELHSQLRPTLIPQTDAEKLKTLPPEELANLKLQAFAPSQISRCCDALLTEKGLSIPEKCIKMLLSHANVKLPLFLRLAVGCLAVDIRAIFATADIASIATLERWETVKVRFSTVACCNCGAPHSV